MTFEEIEEYVEKNKVRGWLLPEECKLLYETARTRGGLVAELGCYRGLSTLYLAAGLKAHGNGKVCSVDNFAGPPGRPNLKKFWGDADTARAKFREHVNGADLADWVNLVVADTIKGSVYFEDESIDILFIDADHRLEGVRADYEVWYRKVKLGGIVMLHNANGCGVNDNSVIHPGAMVLFAAGIIRGEIEEPYLFGTTGVGRKPETRRSL